MSIQCTVLRSGWVISTLEPETYWSQDLDGFVSTHEAATFFETKDQAQALIDHRCLNRVSFPKHVAELLLPEDAVQS